MVVLVPSSDLNPESDKYYGEEEFKYRPREQLKEENLANANKKECP